MQCYRLGHQHGVVAAGVQRRTLVVRAVASPRQPSSEKVPVFPEASADPIRLGTDGGVASTTRRDTLARALLLGAGMAACPCCEALASGGAVFDYGSLSGPQKWGGVCSAGTRQSPINIPRKALAAALKRPTGVGAGTCRPAQLNITGYKPAKPSILNTGVGTMQVRAAAAARATGMPRAPANAAGRGVVVVQRLQHLYVACTGLSAAAPPTAAAQNSWCIPVCNSCNGIASLA